ncbi:hypothetical protein DB347_05455 [Opitutaceae bacterium EW11]|nr:hypothetical protein DB347_05455 [Opitutaceae bacterium EW11]
MSSSRFAALLAAILFSASFLVGASPWPDLPSDLTWDPVWVRGTLPNGFRYAARRNQEPKGRVSLRLLIAVGSVYEDDNERGVAHFIEHLAFRGTQAFPNNTLTATLQRHGIGLGPDNTAFTGYEHTIYHLELPDAEDATLRLGLQVFREYASAISFDSAGIEAERGVVLAEKATRNVAAQRQAEDNLAFLWPDSRYARRAVIGTEAVIQRVTGPELVRFYDAWYRPERMALIAVGDVDPARIAKLAAEMFGPLAPRAEARPEPPDIVPSEASRPDVWVFRDAGISGVQFAFEHPLLRPRTSNTKADRKEFLNRALALDMLQRRLYRVSSDSGYNLIAPSVSVARFVRDWETGVFTANGQVDNWANLASVAEQEHRRAYLHGFAPEELERSRAAFRERYETYIRTAPSRRSEALAAEMAGALQSGDVIVSPEALRDDAAEPLAQATVKDCARAFRRVWERGPLHVLVAANPVFRVTAEQIADVLNSSRLVQVDGAGNKGPTEFAYTDFGAPGRLVREKKEEDLDVRLAEFANGVRLNFKPTAFEADLVDVYVRVGMGRLSQPRFQPGIDLLAYYGFLPGGLGKHRQSEIADLFASKTVSLQFVAYPDAFAFVLRTTRKDFLSGMQLLTAHLTDPGFRTEAMRDASANYNTAVTGAINTPGGALGFSAPRVLFGNDDRFGFALPGEFMRRNMDELRAWLEPQLKNGPIELSVVGDVSWEEASAVVGKTLGALPKRQPRSAAGLPPLPRFAPAPGGPIRMPIGANFKQVTISWYWPVPDKINVHQERRWMLLAACFQERLWQRLREELGATYGPQVGFTLHPGMDGLNYLALSVDVDTSRAADAAAIIRKEVDAIGRKGFPDDEFNRVKLPFLRGREDMLRTNSYWGGTVLGDAQQNPERLVAARDRQTDTPSIASSEIRKLFRRYVTRKAGFLFLAEPGGTVLVWDGK